MPHLRYAVLASAALLSTLGVSGCSVVDHTSTAPTVEPVPTGSTAPALDVQLRPVLAVSNAAAGQCPVTATTPPAADEASLCSADRTLLYRVGPAGFDGPEVGSVEAAWASGSPVVRITVNPQGGAGLVRLTSEAVSATPPRNQVALVSHGRVQAALPVSETIDGRVLDINGFATQEAAQQAVDLLTS